MQKECQGLRNQPAACQMALEEMDQMKMSVADQEFLTLNASDPQDVDTTFALSSIEQRDLVAACEQAHYSPQHKLLSCGQSPWGKHGGSVRATQGGMAGARGRSLVAGVAVAGRICSGGAQAGRQQGSARLSCQSLPASQGQGLTLLFGRGIALAVTEGGAGIKQ